MESFAALLDLCAGNSPVTGEFPAQRPVMRSFDVSFDMSLTNASVNNWDAGDLRGHRAHYDVTVKLLSVMSPSWLRKIWVIQYPVRSMCGRNPHLQNPMWHVINIACKFKTVLSRNQRVSVEYSYLHIFDQAWPDDHWMCKQCKIHTELSHYHTSQLF